MAKKLDTAPRIDLAERAEQLTKEAERLRAGDSAVPTTDDGGTERLDKAVDRSVQRLRNLAQR